MNENLTQQLAMRMAEDKLLELEEHINYEQTLVAELKQLMVDLGAVWDES